MMTGEYITIQGRVQGVGFRPTVARLAHALGLNGWVRNTPTGVSIALFADATQCDAFVQQLQQSLPPLAHITQLTRTPIDPHDPTESHEPHKSAAQPKASPSGFTIRPSLQGTPHTTMLPDAVTCPACLAECQTPSERRCGYPFTNCTHCGPRASITKAIPYDRHTTTMQPFSLCDDCQREYHNPRDRRFHAQPIACPHCGPRLWLETHDTTQHTTHPIQHAAALLKQGAILAIKGLGGFQLCCDATQPDAVDRLRVRKKRPHKPFAVMVRDEAMLYTYACPTVQECNVMAGPAGPIVLVRPNPDQPLAPQIAPDQSHLGIMFPTTPLHHLLLAACDHPIVCTSGNTSHLPPSTHNDQARTQLSKIADAFLFHDREIARRLDDSVVRIIANEPRVFRAGRGFAPLSLPLPPGTKDAPALLATGAQQKATFCLASKDQLVLSPYIGTLDSLDMLQDWQQTLHELLSVYHITPTHVAVDAHPAYEASQFGRHMAEQTRLPLFSIQHHHAHIASCLVEHSYPLDGPPVLGVVLDGLGASEQGELWGGEFIKADYQTYTRLGHCKPVAMIGGDQAAREPWRNAYAHIMAAMGWQTFQTRYNTLPLYEQLSRQPRAILDQSLMTGRRTPLASSCGRLFDAVAAACGLFPERTSYEGQAAIALEALAFRHPQAHNPPNEGYPIRPAQDPTSGLPFLDPTPMWRALLDDMLAGETPATIAMKFHLGLAHGIVMMVRHCQDAFAERPVIVLSGGVWQNALLLEYALPLLRRDGHVVFTHRTIPANDGGLAVGQAMIAIARLQAKGEI